MNRIKWFGLLFFVSICWTASAYAAVKATVDRKIVNEGESLRLVIEGDDDPDISPLNALFDVLGTSTSSQVNIINGRMSSTKQLIVTLSPKESGRLIIPALKVGRDKTKPIEIVVRKAGASIGQEQQDLFIDVDVSSKEVYVQSQLIYTVKLYHAIEIQDGGLSQPKIDNVVVERLGNDRNYSATINGRDYQVTERKYALFPQASGKIEIPSTVFSGQVLDQRGRYSNPGMDPFNRFFSQQSLRPVRLRSKKLSINVKPRPAAAKGKAWLPAENLRLSESWSQSLNSLKLGEPITRTIKIEARGLTGAQLPEIKIAEHPAYKQYPDQANVDNNNDGNSLIGIREEKIAIVPNQEGKITLPAIELAWWNTKKNRQEMASIPARELTVLPGNLPPQAQNQNMLKSTQPLGLSGGSNISSHAPPAEVTAGDDLWKLVALFNLIGWVITTVFLLRQKKTSKMESNDEGQSERLLKANLSHALESIRLSCLENDAAKTRRNILSWAKLAWPENSLLTFQQIVENIQNPKLGKLFSELDSVIYARDSQSWDGHRFWEELSSLLKVPAEDLPRSRSGLPQLYPQI